MKSLQLRLFPLLLVLYEMAVYFSNDMFLPALPQMANELGTSVPAIQQTLTAWFIGGASLQLFLGPIADRWGRRSVVLTGAIIFIISSILCATTNNFAWLIVGRFLQGSAISSVVIGGYATIHELFEQKRAIKILASMNSVTILAPALGPLLGGIYLEAYHGWRGIFWILAVWAAMITVALVRLMPETLEPSKKHSINMKDILKNYRHICFNREFLTNTFSFCLVFGAMITWIVAGPFLVIDKFKYSVLMFGVFQACIFGSFILGTRCVAWVLKHATVAVAIKVGLLLALFGGLAAIIVSFAFPHHLPIFVATLSLHAAGVGFIGAPLQRSAVEGCTAPMGAIMAVFSFITSIFGMFASVAISIFYTGHLSEVALIVGISTALAVGIKWWGLQKTKA